MLYLLFGGGMGGWFENGTLILMGHWFDWFWLIFLMGHWFDLLDWFFFNVFYHIGT